MGKWKIVFTTVAVKDSLKIAKSLLKEQVQNLLDVLGDNPYQNPPPYEKLVGDLKEFYSRRINVKHRLVYQILDQQKIIKVVSMWNHY